MVASALNFAAGFFGIPMYQTDYNQVIVIENSGFNNSLAPYDTCLNSNTPLGALWYDIIDSLESCRSLAGNFGSTESAIWIENYLQSALARLRPQITGINLTVSDVFGMQQTCAYEVRSF